MNKLAQSLLAGLRQEDERPDAADERFMRQAAALDADDMLFAPATAEERKDWDESQHDRRDDGKFGSGGGAHAPADAPHDAPDVAAKTTHGWAALASKLPVTVYASAKTKVQRSYAKLKSRYGKPMALAIVLAGIVATPLPAPGATLLAVAPLVGLAELVLALRGRGKSAMSQEQVGKLGKEFVRQLLAEWQQETGHKSISGMGGATGSSGGMLVGGDKKDVHTRLLDVPDVRQIHDFDCGAASTAAVASHLGVDGGRTEEDWISELQTEPTDMEANGTRWQRIVQWFTEHGCHVEVRDHCTIDDLDHWWRRGMPVIMCLQDWWDVDKPQEIEANESGHYVVSIGLWPEEKYVIIQDPSEDNAVAGDRLPVQPDSDAAPGRAMVPYDTLMRVWHDVDQTGQVMERFAIAIAGPGTMPADKQLSDEGIAPGPQTTQGRAPGMAQEPSK